MAVQGHLARMNQEVAGLREALGAQRAKVERAGVETLAALHEVASVSEVAFARKVASTSEIAFPRKVASAGVETIAALWMQPRGCYHEVASAE